MESLPSEQRRALACCHGYSVVADDGVLGDVETPLFPRDSDVPDYLVVRGERTPMTRRTIVATARVVDVDRDRRVVRVDGRVSELSHLPRSLPLAYPDL